MGSLALDNCNRLISLSMATLLRKALSKQNETVLLVYPCFGVGKLDVEQQTFKPYLPFTELAATILPAWKWKEHSLDTG